MATYNIVAGTTSTLRFQLLEAGAPINLLGCTVTLLLSDRNGTTIVSPGTVSITDSDEGKIQLVPTSASVFVSANSPYTARWQIVDAATKISYVPTGPRDIWEIVGA
jgi:hypothetical protein